MARQTHTEIEIRLFDEPGKLVVRGRSTKAVVAALLSGAPAHRRSLARSGADLGGGAQPRQTAEAAQGRRRADARTAPVDRPRIAPGGALPGPPTRGGERAASRHELPLPGGAPRSR